MDPRAFSAPKKAPKILRVLKLIQGKQKWGFASGLSHGQDIFHLDILRGGHPRDHSLMVGGSGQSGQRLPGPKRELDAQCASALDNLAEPRPAPAFEDGNLLESA